MKQKTLIETMPSDQNLNKGLMLMYSQLALSSLSWEERATYYLCVYASAIEQKLQNALDEV